MSVRLKGTLTKSGPSVNVKSKLVWSPGKGSPLASKVTLSTIIWPGTLIGTWKPSSQRHFEGAPGGTPDESRPGPPTSATGNGLVHKSLSPGCFQLVQLGRLSSPSPSVSIHITVSVTVGNSGLWASSMSPQVSWMFDTTFVSRNVSPVPFRSTHGGSGA